MSQPTNAAAEHREDLVPAHPAVAQKRTFDVSTDASALADTAPATGQTQASLSEASHFTGELGSVLIQTVRGFGGDDAVARVLRESGCTQPLAELEKGEQWLSFNDAIALLDAGERVTRDPFFARRVGEAAIPTMKGSPVPQMLRSLGSPEEVYRHISATSGKMNRVAYSEAREVRPGYAELVIRAREGFPRAHQHCEWTRGLLTQPPLAFGLPPAIVEHEQCAATGAEACVYRVIWQSTAPAATGDRTLEIDALREQLKAMSDRLENMFASAADLIESDDINVTLARITDRAVAELRNPRCLLVIKPAHDADALVQARGLNAGEVQGATARILANGSKLPASWLMVPVRSHRRDYGWLVSIYEHERLIYPQERRLLEVFAGYAAAALDSATALTEATQRHQQASALLELARALSSAMGSKEIAERLVAAVPRVIDCDIVQVYVWQEGTGELVRKAMTHSDDIETGEEELSIDPENVQMLREHLEKPRSEAIYVDSSAGESRVAHMLAALGAEGSVIVPIATRRHLLGGLIVSVTARPERLRSCPELLDRISGVAAHATAALENGRLMDQITYQARHDALTGLLNRGHFSERLLAATQSEVATDSAATVFYIDIDCFKTVNDTRGHAAGDELLRQVAERLLECVRTGDIVARIGGDEFAVLVHDIADTKEVEIVAGRLTEAFGRPFALDGESVAVNASIGRASWPADAAEIDALMQSADDAMYEVKRAHQRAAQGSTTAA